LPGQHLVELVEEPLEQAGALFFGRRISAANAGLRDIALTIAISVIISASTRYPLVRHWLR